MTAVIFHEPKAGMQVNTIINKPQLQEGEFVILIAMMMSLAALAIDAVLPALPAIGTTFGVESGNTIQQVVGVLFLGLTIGQLIYGPLSDRFGRRSALFTGMLIFMAGSLLTIFSQDFTTMLAGRFSQGFGVAALRIVPLAIVRDKYEGTAMARVMSIAVAVFILVPCISPLLGQSILMVAEWQAIFWVLFVMSGIITVWFGLRQPETLHPSNRTAGGIKPILQGVKVICTNRTTVAYIIVMGLLQGPFMGYIMTAEQIFHDVYHTGNLFALYFASAAISIGIASLVNSQIVERLGMQKICRIALLGSVLISNFALTLEVMGILPFYGFLCALAAIFFCFGLLLGNMNTIALEPLGHIAGLANSVISFMSGVIGLGIASMIGAAFNSSIQPLMFGVLITSLLSLVIVVWIDQQKA